MLLAKCIYIKHTLSKYIRMHFQIAVLNFSKLSCYEKFTDVIHFSGFQIWIVFFKKKKKDSKIKKYNCFIEKRSLIISLIYLADILVNMLKNERKKAQDALFQLNAASAGSTSLKQSHCINVEESQNPSRFFSVKEAKDLSSSVHRLPFLSRMKG